MLFAVPALAPDHESTLVKAFVFTVATETLVGAPALVGVV